MNQVNKELHQHLVVTDRDEQSMSLDLILPETFIGFVGHFEGYPILPAVIQMSIGKIASSLLLAKTLTTIKVPVAKFKKQICPGDEISAKINIVKITGDNVTMSCQLYLGEEIASTFKTVYGM